MGKTVEGDGWAFTDIECIGLNINNLFEILNNYPHLRSISFERNKISDYSPICKI